MEQLSLILGQDETFDKLVHGGLPQCSSVTIATKDCATANGMPGAVIAFDVKLPDGTVKQVQATMTLRLLTGFYTAVRGRYGPGGPQAHRFKGNESPFIF